MDQIKILLAEDNPVNQKVAELMLRKVGYEIDIEPNGKLAIEALQKDHHHIVLMDANMPVMDGITATKWIRENIEQKFQPKILVMTATVMVEAREDWKSVEIDGYIEKPVRIDVLKNTLDEVIEKIRAEENE